MFLAALATDYDNTIAAHGAVAEATCKALVCANMLKASSVRIKSFYFRGPENALNLRAQNLMIFLQMAAGVDEATWLHHLHAGDYSR